MTFLAIDSQKALFTMQKSQLQLEKSIIVSRASTITKEMQAYTEAHKDDDDYENDATYKELESTEEYYETRQDSIDSQITLMENAISGLKSLVTSNIKSTCTLNLISG